MLTSSPLGNSEVLGAIYSNTRIHSSLLTSPNGVTRPVGAIMTNSQESKVLLVDDNSIVRDSIRGLLESEPGWVICGEASNGLEAIEFAEALKPDLILMDLVMPNIGGLQATREIVTRNPAARVLIMTLHDFPDLSKRAMAAGARGFLGKSDFGVKLLDVLRTLAGSDVAAGGGNQGAM